MVNALFVSGGVNSIGSLRNIELKRDGQTVATLDLSIGKTVRVDGAVKRPAIYELKNERSTEDVIELAGGLLPTAFPKASQIERISEERERIIVDVDQGTKAGLAVNVEDDDVIRVYSVWFNRGGRVEIQPDDTIVVPLKTDAVRPLAFWKSVAQILYQSAIAVAAVETFGN
jgi:protein involved in polysaccharide export with SLBB domain